MDVESLKFKVCGRDLSRTEFEKLTAFLFALNRTQRSTAVNLIYRGESYSNIKSKLNMDGESPDYQKLSDFIFLLGEKGKAYQREYRAKVKNSYKLFSIDNASDLFFKYIFRKFNKALRLSKYVVDDFKRSNLQFATYFFCFGTYLLQFNTYFFQIYHLRTITYDCFKF